MYIVSYYDRPNDRLVTDVLNEEMFSDSRAVVSAICLYLLKKDDAVNAEHVLERTAFEVFLARFGTQPNVLYVPAKIGAEEFL